MKFEEVLPLMREGKPIWLPNPEGDYWIAGRASLPGMDAWLTMIKLNKDGEAPYEPSEWGIPRWMIMSSDWELYERA